eukprot:10452127-Alexandrium_andersonii.AAC.1
MLSRMLHAAESWRELSDATLAKLEARLATALACALGIRLKDGRHTFREIRELAGIESVQCMLARARVLRLLK